VDYVEALRGVPASLRARRGLVCTEWNLGHRDVAVAQLNEALRYGLHWSAAADFVCENDAVSREHVVLLYGDLDAFLVPRHGASPVNARSLRAERIEASIEGVLIPGICSAVNSGQIALATRVIELLGDFDFTYGRLFDAFEKCLEDFEHWLDCQSSLDGRACRFSSAWRAAFRTQVEGLSN
jgi:hypothetical protein